MELTQELLKEFLHYDPKTGYFSWLKRNSTKPKIGKPIITKRTDYLGIRIVGTLYQAHRLVWLYMYGAFPPESMDIDHINRNGIDNRLCNLRLCTRSENSCNQGLRSTNTSGIKGLEIRLHKGKLSTCICCVEKEGERRRKSFPFRDYITHEECIQEAGNWLKQTRLEMHKDYALHVDVTTLL